MSIPEEKIEEYLKNARNSLEMLRDAYAWQITEEQMEDLMRITYIVHEIALRRKSEAR